jgi:2-C-methyl-D-erythritol 2,4-cyclodiphosphate synthase
VNDGLQYEYRTGIGTDIHKLVSDDVLLHAVIDAVLGAAGLGDIGSLFPDTDPQWKDASSSDLLYEVREYYKQYDWEVVNLDVIIHAQLPKLEPYKGQIKREVAGLLEIDFSNVNIKAKTNEGLDAVGDGRAIAATAAVLMQRRIKRTL